MSRVATASSEAERHEARRRWLSVPRLAERWGVSDDLVRLWITGGELVAMDVSRPGARMPEYRVEEAAADAFEAARKERVKRRASGAAASQ